MFFDDDDNDVMMFYHLCRPNCRLAIKRSIFALQVHTKTTVTSHPSPWMIPRLKLGAVDSAALCSHGIISAR